MDQLSEIPEKVLGFRVKTRWQITSHYLVPCIIELMVYVSLSTIDLGVAYQHWLDRNRFYAVITLVLISIPALLTFVCVMLSDQWPEEEEENGEKSGCCRKSNFLFFGRQLVNLVFFPIAAIYRFARKIFWCVEALFHEKNSYERYQAVSKAAEHSPFELYHFLQSFFHSAPQVILQLFILLREDSFRNYDTAFIQSLSVVFGLIKMAMTVESFQRFETRKRIGKTYPWYARHQVEAKCAEFRRQMSVPVENQPSPMMINNNQTISDDKSRNYERTKSMNVDSNNFDNSTKVDKKAEITKTFVSNITDDDKIQAAREEGDFYRQNSYDTISPNQDLVENIHEIKEYLRSIESIDYVEINEDMNLDQVPTLPPPPRPTSTKHPYIEKLHRISQFKDMLIFDAEKFIKENVPRLPAGLFEHEINEKEIKTSPTLTPTLKSETFSDEIDAVLLPSRRALVDGIEEEDIIAKFVSFLGWVMFLIMRMISLSVFAVFYPEICGYICLAHYLLMLIALINETRFAVKWQRTAFYFILAYIYIFNIMEFKVKFRNVRNCYVWYFALVFIQNTAMTVTWYGFTEFLDTWWFEFMFLTIVQSGLMSLMCFLLYIFYLKPSEKVVEVRENQENFKS